MSESGLFIPRREDLEHLILTSEAEASDKNKLQLHHPKYAHLLRELCRSGEMSFPEDLEKLDISWRPRTLDQYIGNINISLEWLWMNGHYRRPPFWIIEKKKVDSEHVRIRFATDTDSKHPVFLNQAYAFGLKEIYPTRDAFHERYSYRRIFESAPPGSDLFFCAATSKPLVGHSENIALALERGVSVRILTTPEHLQAELQIDPDHFVGRESIWRKSMDSSMRGKKMNGTFEIRTYGRLHSHDLCHIFPDAGVQKLALIWRFGSGEGNKAVCVFYDYPETSLYPKFYERFDRIYRLADVCFCLP